MSWASRANESQYTWNSYGDLEVQNAVIMQGRTLRGKWSNFAGAPTNYNTQGGKRTFNLVLSEKMAEELSDLGWNIRKFEPRNEEDDVTYFTEVILNMDSRWEPKVMLCSEWNGKKTMNRLYGDTVGQLDDMRFENLDLIIHPRENRPDSKFRYKGYCNTLIATQRKVEMFGGKYDDYEMSINSSD